MCGAGAREEASAVVDDADLSSGNGFLGWGGWSVKEMAGWRWRKKVARKPLKDVKDPHAGLPAILIKHLQLRFPTRRRLDTAEEGAFERDKRLLKKTMAIMLFFDL